MRIQEKLLCYLYFRDTSSIHTKFVKRLTNTDSVVILYSNDEKHILAIINGVVFTVSCKETVIV